MSRKDPPYDPANPRHSLHAMVLCDPVTRIPTEPVSMCLMCQNYVYFPLEHLRLNGGYCTMCLLRGYRSKRGDKGLKKYTTPDINKNKAKAVIPCHSCGSDQGKSSSRPRCRCESSIEWILMRCDPRSKWRFWPVALNNELSMGIPAFWIDTWRPEHSEALRKAFETNENTDKSRCVNVVSNADFVETQMAHSDDPEGFMASLKKHTRLCDLQTGTVMLS